MSSLPLVFAPLPALADCVALGVMQNPVDVAQRVGHVLDEGGAAKVVVFWVFAPIVEALFAAWVCLVGNAPALLFEVENALARLSDLLVNGSARHGYSPPSRSASTSD